MNAHFGTSYAPICRRLIPAGARPCFEQARKLLALFTWQHPLRILTARNGQPSIGPANTLHMHLLAYPVLGCSQTVCSICFTEAM